MAEPSTAELEIAADRAEIARNLREAMQEAIDECGEGATAYAQWIEIDSTGAEPDRITNCCRRDGKGWMPPAPQNDERTPAGLFRWRVHFRSLGSPATIYKPKTAEQLAADRERREQKQREKLADAVPLFADQALAGTFPIKSKNQLKHDRPGIHQGGR